MHPDSQPLEASFKPAAGQPQEPSGPIDPVVEDFNTFFEKLSALDHLQWSDGDRAGEPAPPPPGEAAARPAPRAPRRKAPAKPAAPRMTVLQSDRDLGAPAGGGSAAVPSAAEVERVARGRITARDVARFLKLTLVGLLLFALGLAAGWAALSLPGQMNVGLPSVSDLMERARSAVPLRREAVGASDALRLEPVKPAAPASQAAGTAKPIAMAEARSTTPHARNAARPAAGSGTKAAAKPKASAAAHNLGAEDAFDAAEASGGSDRIELPAVTPEAPAPAVAGTAARTAASTPAQPAASAQAGGTEQFALQVGACSSYECVQAYRNLLLRRVTSSRIKVVPSTHAPGQAAIQRIRIEPLGHAEGERLKSELAIMDARFSDAYLIALH